jgi:hypothetical protein
VWGVQPPGLPAFRGTLMNASTAILGDMLLDLAAEPLNNSLRNAVAALLEEDVPGLVELNKVPNWLRLSWCRRRTAEMKRHSMYYTGTGGWEVFNEISSYLCSCAGTSGGRMDHWGSTTIHGHLCFANEPYHDVSETVRWMLPLGQLLGVAVAYSRKAAWHSGCCRVLVFPPPDGKPLSRLTRQRRHPRTQGVRP